ncbi:DNA-processing protein DprA [Marinitenerispora sediminis]|uniref:DNA-protecting protein DprA n=1 Tax=Marinitenerispora sediminis TaxID=1931232 RepID=A0A368SYE2_9ACTN|nr:DNA-processing protein DprA [Marinitenerispora sediminis]RCV47611.1 DNA-protecting protein DprA [Marinitenerispora sediminis]RCV47894.1 DNA-protecting protein DprA [Marinitenerispora sediminis]RCV49173.1 DNA-protecting protein DprA [Marinitenerispora sediminis]
MTAPADEPEAPEEPVEAGAAADDALARACLTAVAAPGDPLLGRLLDRLGAARVWSALRGTAPLPVEPAETGGAEPRIRRWRDRARRVDPDTLLAGGDDLGARLVVPGDPEWPGQLDALGERRPYALWVRGAHDLRNACLRSVAVVGARAASPYGVHVAGELAYALAERSWATVSGGAYGIDGAAHRGALAGGAATVVVLACGLDIGYPRGHESLFAEVAARGTLVSEHPPGTAPTRPGFLVRNRLIAALTPGTVVVEAGARSGAINTAAHARDLCRALMAVPGPVTSASSVGCHRLLRDWQAVCVTDAADVIEHVGPIGEDLRPESGPVVPRDHLDPVEARVLAAVPERPGAAGTAAVALAAGLDLDGALRRLGLLAAGGFVERAPGGWRTRTHPASPARARARARS